MNIEQLLRDSDRLRNIAFWLMFIPSIAVGLFLALTFIAANENGESVPPLIVGLALSIIAWLIALPPSMKVNASILANDKLIDEELDK